MYHSEEKKGTSECTYSVPETNPPFTIFGFQYLITETAVEEVYKLLFHNVKFLEFNKNKAFTAFFFTDPHMVGTEAVIKNRIECNRVFD